MCVCVYVCVHVLPKKKKKGNILDLHMHAASRKNRPCTKRIPLANHHLVFCPTADEGAMGIPCKPDCGEGDTPDNIGTSKGTQMY